MTIEVSDIQLAALVRGDAVTVGPSKRVITLDDGPFVVQRHHGPGPHPGTGTPQEVHGGGKERPLETGVFNPNDIERVQPMRGFCFERCAEWLMLEQGKEYEQARLVHGTVMGQGSLEGVRFVHAWVEIDDWVYDVSQDILSPKDYYYQLAEAEDMVSYTGTEAAVNSLKEKNWGPWEENLVNFKEEELRKWITGK